MHIVIIGAGQAGGRAAEALRAVDADCAITLVGVETHPPYERPPLSKGVLTGAQPVATTYLNPTEFYAANRIVLRLGVTATEIDRAGRRVHLDDGGVLGYDALLLTTGARARRLAIPGADGADIHHLRDIDDCLALSRTLGPGRRLAVIGAGFIGLEVAAAARALETEVTVVEFGAHPLGRVAPPALGAWFADLHRAHGVDLRLGAAATAIDRDGSAPLTLRLADGEAIRADALAVGIGAVPNTELAAAAGLAVDDGIVVDEFGRTSDPAIFAAGDVTRHWNPLLCRSLRLEAWQNAQNQAIAVARAMVSEGTGTAAPHAEIPWFWSDQYDVNLQSAGHFDPAGAVVWRGDPTGKAFALFYLMGDRLVGASTVNQGREMRMIRKRIAEDRPIDPRLLADTTLKLADCLI
ncbi:MAG TPA: FAD-dependent oxidoreductase [Stellaceae bacterium]|nr:FAD-dependent oxidoreductase [Stellaceae bacterium]